MHATAIESISTNPENAPAGDDFWHALIDEGPTAEFLDLSPRTLQEYRRKGGGPQYVRISARCVKYTRFLAWQWYMSLLRKSTSDGQEAA